MTAGSKVTPCLWFEKEGEKAAEFYVRTFRACGQEAAMGRVMRYGKGAPLPEGSVLSLEFALGGQAMMLLNGGPWAKPSPYISLFVTCEDQAEVDGFWAAFSEGGQVQQCGWLTDRFGTTWQIVPRVLGEMLRDPEEARAGRVMQAMMGMVKLDIAVLERAYAG